MADVIDLLSSDEEEAAAAAPPAAPAPAHAPPPPAPADDGVVDLSGADDGADDVHSATVESESKFSQLVAEVDEAVAGAGLVEGPADGASKPAAKRKREGEEKKPAPPTHEELMQLSAAELRSRCRKAHCGASGTKSAMANRLIARAAHQMGNAANPWAAGTGFGGVHGQHSTEGWRDTSETLAQQRKERRLAQRLQALRVGLPIGSFAPDVLPILRGAKIRQGIAALIRQASLDALTADRRKLFIETLELLASFARHHQAQCLLVEPLQDPAPEAAAGAAAAAAAPAPSLRTLLGELEQQAKIFVGGFEASGGGEEGAAAAAGGDDDDGMMHGIAVALHVKAVAELLAELPEHEAPEPPAAAAQKPAVRATRSRRRAAASSESKKAEESAEASGAAYCAALKPLQLDEAEDLARGHYFAKQQQSGAQGARLLRQVSVLATALPLDAGSSVFVRYDSSRFSMLRACIVGPAGTPYDGGLFFFDIFLPAQFPAVPPKVQLLTTGSGRVRFNPNLYNCGKVCLSLLGTWAGPGWIPNKSTLIQVLVSIQSLILVEQPYFNEPSYEQSIGTPQGERQSKDYNTVIRRGTVAHAILAPLRSPPPFFEAVVAAHFSRIRERAIRVVGEWVAEDKAGSRAEQLGNKPLAELKRLLKKLPS